MSPAQAEFVESFAVSLYAAGMPRMPARVFGVLMLAPDGGLTAREIAERLDVSAGAVSGATRYVTQTGLAHRRRSPGERSDRFEVRGSSWAESMLTRSEMVRSFSDALNCGIAATEEPAAVERMNQIRDFFSFLERRLPDLVQEWRGMRDSPV